MRLSPGKDARIHAEILLSLPLCNELGRFGDARHLTHSWTLELGALSVVHSILSFLTCGSG